MLSVLVNILPGHLNLQEKMLPILGGGPGSQGAQGSIPQTCCVVKGDSELLILLSLPLEYWD